MASHNHDVITSSENPNWRTPRWLVAALDREFGIVLDAAASMVDRVIPDGHFLGPGSELLDNALAGVPWWDIVKSVYLGCVPLPNRAIFCNPPYSRKQKMPIEPWVKMMAETGRDGTVIGVLPYSPQTEWWRLYVEGHSDPDSGQPYSTLKATEIRKFPFRLKFEPPPDYKGDASGANVNTAVVIWKPGIDYIEPWAPFQRYWIPAEYHAAKHQR